MFVDRVEIQVRAGRGGDGCISFRREKFIPRGGPDGGDGGDGGSIVIVAQQGVDSLAALAHRKHWKALSGDPGRGAQCHGRSAEDLVIAVPPGTIVMDSRGGYVLKDLADGDRLVAARGGKGGKGNTRFKTSTNRAPRQNTPGEEGEHRELILELKVIADVGVIGKPNAGKSTLLSRLSRARPEIADYPFTTKYPNLGLVQLNADRGFVMADIPGLIEGAHEGVGLGHEFLRHIERAGILVHLVEPEPSDGSDPLANYHAIRSELHHYDARLDERPEIVAVSKAELPAAPDIWRRLAQDLGRDVLAISAVTGAGLDKLLYAIAHQLDARPQLRAHTMSAQNFPLVAVDVGNSRIKLGLFEVPAADADQPGLPLPTSTFELGPEPSALDRIDDWIGPARVPQLAWWIGSVQRTVSSRLVEWLRNRGVAQIVLLASADLPLKVALERPDMVGIDRLLGAVSANVLRPHDTAAIVVDLGTAITVDLVAAEGSFQGGAILPGIGLSAKALYEFTDLLPQLDMQSLADPPPALGTNTIAAMRAGIYWGAIGGVRHLIDLFAAELPRAPQVFLTGGAAPAVARLVAPTAIYAPHLVLAGIALAARK